MTLRGRLTTAFLAVVLGPVLLGAVFVGGTVAAVSRERTTERLDAATTAVRTSVGALCRQLQAAADAIAIVPDVYRQAAADQLVARDLASAVSIVDSAGTPVYTTTGALTPPWSDCAGGDAGGRPLRAVEARAELRDDAGAVLGAVHVARALDATFVERLAATTGTAVTLMSDPTRSTVVHSTEPAHIRDAVAARAAGLELEQAGRTEHGRYVRMAGPVPGQPLPLAVSVPAGDPRGLYAVLVAAVLLAGLAAVLAAWWLARTTTRPLAEVARAADRVAGGDLDARVPVRGQDEIGRLAGAFNRMTREMQAYVQALTASRDQLRGHLTILGDTLSGTHDLPRILHVLLQTALAATGARGGVVLLAEPEAGVLVGRCGEGLAGRWPGGDDVARLRLPLGQGLLGSVAATGEPRRGRLDRDGPQPVEGEPVARTYVAVPICAPAPAGSSGTAAPLGVLALYDRLGADEFDDADLVTLRTFAGQAGVAVDNVRVHEEAQRLSLTDPLTGLWNYRYLKESVRREVERASRFGRMLTVLALDLDRFKEVNDTYGHGAGDAVLAEFARRIRAALREVDLAFRQGGEEFVVLLPETDASGGATVADRLGAAVRDTPMAIEPSRLDPATGSPVGSIAVTVSIGIAVYPDHGGTAQQVLDAADDALYAAKAAGRDTYRIAVSAPGPVGQELSVAARAASPDDGLPRAGGAGGAPGGPHPPRQSRGR